MSSQGEQFEVRLDLSEFGEWLRPYVVELLDLLGPYIEVPDDPLVALATFGADPAERPDDPVLARLLPDGIVGDEAAAAEFRQFSHATLRARKREDANGLLQALGEGAVTLSRTQVMAVLGALNDLRLMLGTKLLVTQDEDFQPQTPEDAHAYAAYDLAAHLQEGLVSVLGGTA